MTEGIYADISTVKEPGSSILLRVREEEEEEDLLHQKVLQSADITLHRLLSL